MAGCAGIFAPTYADETVAIDLSQKPIDVPTLDYLNSQGVIMPPQKDANGEIIDATEQVYPKSSYTLEQTDTTGANTIQKYTYDPETHELTETNYKVNLTHEITNIGTGDGVNYYKWGTAEKDSILYNILEDATQDDYAIKANYTTDNQLERIFHSDGSNYGDVDGNFINIEKYVNYEGAAITVSVSKMGNITANFVNNKGYHGVIANRGNAYIGDITGDFIGNYTSGTGGVIWNSGGSIGNIKGNFVANHTMGTGGVIDSQGGSIASITGNFIGNRGDSQAGAISLRGTKIGSIKGNFIGNSSKYSYGGAIYNEGLIGDITGDFIGNQSSGRGAAIYVGRGAIGDITGDFIGNIGVYSGAIECIYNTSKIGNITGDFIGNKATDGIGGAIDNYGNIDYITGNFINNSSGQYAGAICNWAGAGIKGITGNFIGNKTGEGGGAIRDCSGIDFIKGNFINNGIETANYGYIYDYGYGYGGAIYLSNSKSIGLITGDFINNYIIAAGTESGSASAYGGAIAYGRIDKLIGDFIGNSASAVTEAGSASAYGGVFYSPQQIGNMNSDFINNSVKAVSDSGNALAYGGVICYGTYGDIEGDFKYNYAVASSSSETATTTAKGGAIYNTGVIGAKDENGNVVGGLKSNFIGNYAQAGNGEVYGGAIYSDYATLGYIQGDFVDNYAISDNSTAKGGAIYNNGGKIGDITGSFRSNHANSEGGAIWTSSGRIGKITGDFIDNYVSSTTSDAKGGAIFSSYGGSNNTINGLYNTNLINNYARTENGQAQGGAIFTRSNLDIITDNDTSIIKGNYTESNGIKDDNAIYLDNGATLNFNLNNNGKVFMYDNIRGSQATFKRTDEEGNETVTIKNYSVNIQGDDKDLTTFYMYNDMYDANLSVGNTTLNMINNQSHVYNVNSFTLTGDTNLAVDVDLKNQTMDRFSANSYGEHTGNLNVIGMNLLSDAPENRPLTEILFAEEGLKNNVTYGAGELPHSDYQTLYTPIFKYNVAYDNRDDAGYFLFTKGDRIITPDGGTLPTGNPSDAFNPAVLSAPVAGVAAAQATVNETFKFVFEHADAFTQMPSVDRMTMINANKYALSDSQDGVSTDFNENLGHLCPCSKSNKAGWFRPYVTFETMNLKNGPKINATTYGSLAGFDTDFFEHKRGWHSVGTGYIGYNGSQLSYSGVDTTMNGGLLGYTHTMYKGNFWTALTLTAGASVGQSKTMYGKEDFTSLMAGVGSKTGYNFEFKEGKYILQPIMFMSYTFVNTFDYTNAAGVKINADPAHSIQLNPSIRFISNFKNGWQPYASVGMVWNVMNENNVTANNVRLPEMSMKPYVEYGVGVQRNWKDKFTAFGQAMLRNGGRNGIALTAGFRWALGKDTPHHNDKVQAPKTDRTVLKQLTPQQKMALTGKKNTTITSAKAVLKQL